MAHDIRWDRTTDKVELKYCWYRVVNVKHRSVAAAFEWARIWIQFESRTRAKWEPVAGTKSGDFVVRPSAGEQITANLWLTRRSIGRWGDQFLVVHLYEMKNRIKWVSISMDSVYTWPIAKTLTYWNTQNPKSWLRWRNWGYIDEGNQRRVWEPKNGVIIEKSVPIRIVWRECMLD